MNMYPFGAPAVDGNKITVDQAMNQPKLITRTITDLIANEFWATKLLPNIGGVEGGAILFERPNPYETDVLPVSGRGFGEMGPDDEAPIQDFTRGVPMIARPRDIGGKFEMSRRAIKQNDQRQLSDNMRKMANAAQQTIEEMAIAEIKAVIDATSRYTEVETDWDTMAETKLLDRTGDESPLVQMIDIAISTREEKRGHKLTKLLCNPRDWAVLVGYYSLGGSDGVAKLKEVFAHAEIDEIITSIFYPEGQALLFSAGGVGGLAWEFPLAETVIDLEKVSGRHAKQYQLDGAPCFVVADQFAMMEIRDIRATEGG